MCTSYDTPDDWHKQVYEPLIDDVPDNWEAIKLHVCWRDDERCQMCDSRAFLTVHHIMPREEGGSHDMSNLITLCTNCHDVIELAGIRDVGLIKNWFNYRVVDRRPKGKTWQQWVYGGYRRPA